MTRLNVTAEGFSEERFVSEILRPHLIKFDIYTDVRKVLTSRKLNKRGGVVGYPRFKKDVMQWIKEQPGAYHTTFIDLYGLATNFPNYTSTIGRQPYERVNSMQKAMGDDINHRKFIPFIQLHEYETLLFADADITESWLSLYNKVSAGQFQSIVNQCEGNPELINEHPSTAPSKRILSLCPIYDKVDDGILILKEIGLNKLRKACKHFNNWITSLEKLA